MQIQKQNITKRQVLSTCHLFQILYCGSQNNASEFNKNTAYAYIGFLKTVVRLLGFTQTPNIPPVSFQRANTTERRIKWDRAFPPGTDVTRAGVGREAGSRAPERSV